ncbi:serine/threonine-protein kinase [Tsukamurella sp. 1534]|uniref:serine/threonine-protein kinase n=1 Tax=Tsukamurella sp. 1534 TaxID=1151061 RepID=UPI0002F6BD55|nr:serine/threonine-protein kinase [Tsukamurella sp. 1534]
MLHAGEDFAGYRIERMLGAGGMGEVYVARHPRLPRSDALKVLAPQFAADAHYRARFEREADLAAALAHPAIVMVHDRGEFEGRLWIALAYVDGADVARIAAAGRLPNAEVVRIVAAVADALDYAGARGLVHRDVKPANILVSTDRRILLTDFGIARMGDEASDLTGTGVTVGTLQYASPEQLRGLTVGPRSDQYSLACTAFHLLAGSAPFADSNAANVIAGHLAAPVPTVRRARPDLTPQVDAVLARGMAKDPAHRFGTSGEFAAALGRVLQASPGWAPSAPAPHDPDRTHLRGREPVPAPTVPAARRTGRAAAAIGLVALLLVAAAGYGGYRWLRSPGAGDGPTAAAAALPRVSSVPALPSLAAKPEKPRWEVSDDWDFLDATERLAAFQVRSRPGGIAVVDAATGRPTRPVIALPNLQRVSGCAARERRLACVGESGAQEPLLAVVDLESGAVSTKPVGDKGDAAFVGENAVWHTEKEAIAFRPDGTEAWRLSAETVQIHPTAGFAVAIAAAPKGDPFGKGIVTVLDGGGREMLRREYEAGRQSPVVRTSMTGLLLETRDALEVVARDGTVRPVAGGWQGAHDCFCDAPPSLPVVWRAEGDRTVVAAIDPATGETLWSRAMFGKRVSGAEGSATVEVRGAGTAIMGKRTQSNTSGSDTTAYDIRDAYTAEGGDVFFGRTGEIVGSDGTRALVRLSSPSGLAAYAVGEVAESWALPFSAAPFVEAGGVYVGNRRVM